jgi:ABC-type multidrug transport system fused ATPase/permease subunit
VIYVEPDHLNDCKEDCPGMEFDDKVNLDESKYTGGDMLACFLGVLFGVFSLAFTLPNFQQIVDGKSSGWYAYQIIERKPEILRDDPSKSYKNLNGDIEFKDVSFSYDSKKQVLRSINLNIEYGKTTAIVG